VSVDQGASASRAPAVVARQTVATAPPGCHPAPTNPLPQKEHNVTTDLDLTKYKALSFDCYGTLIDWETGIAAVLAPWAREQGLNVSNEELLLAYADNEAAVERETPSALYPDVLAMAFRRTGERLSTPVSDAWAQRLGDSVPDWPAFPDSADALARLAQRYKLIILSNVHRAGFAASNQRLRGDFAAIITAEDVGAYKPAEEHFRALDATLPGLGVDRGGLLHVAQSLFHDHVPAKREGLPSAWINRRHDRPGWGATPAPSEWDFDLEFNSMADLADAVDQSFTDA
jgi:2-haloacid dehalogenase